MPAIFMMESMMDHVAKALGMDTEAVKKMNLYKQGQVHNDGLCLLSCHYGKYVPRSHLLASTSSTARSALYGIVSVFTITIHDYNDMMIVCCRVVPIC